LAAHNWRADKNRTAANRKTRNQKSSIERSEPFESGPCDAGECCPGAEAEPKKSLESGRGQLSVSVADDGIKPYIPYVWGYFLDFLAGESNPDEFRA